MANRAIDFLITYRIVKLLSTDFKDQEAFKFGIIDANGKVLRPSRTLNTQAELDSYTVLHRFVFNLKRILSKLGLKSSLSNFGVALAFILKENKDLIQYKSTIESAVISYLKETNQYNDMIKEVSVIKESKEKPFMNCFGIDIYERNGELVSEYEIV
jgi:two-component SAPR family response regulator